MARVTAHMRSSAEAAGRDITADDSSQDLFGPDPSASDLGPDSETPELLIQDTQPATASPQLPSGLRGGGGGGPGGGPTPPPGPPPPGQLLQPLCALRRAGGPAGGPGSLWFCPDDASGSLLVDSVCQLLDSVVAAFRDPPPPGPRDRVLQVCRVAAGAMDLFCSQRLPSVEFTRRVEEALAELTEMLLHRRLEAAETLMESLLTLGGGSMSSSFLVRHVLARISAVADRLWLGFQALGNHEFDNGVDGLMTPFMQQIRCPVLSANIEADRTLAPTFGASFLPYKILSVGGERVGVVGYTSQETPALSRPGPHLQFQDEVNAVQLQVDKLHALGVNKVIALGHSGFTVDRLIAKKVRGVDVVIGGHSNTFLFTGPPPSSEVPAGPYPFMVKSDDGRQVPVVQAYAFGKYLGRLKVTFDDAGKVVKSSGNPILLDSSVPQDPEVLADVEEWKKNLANYSAQVVGKTLVFLNGTSEECRFRECNLGNLICDAMVSNNIREPDDEQWNHVGAAIFNGGGVRTSVDEHARNGSITMEDLISVLPFGETFDLVQLRGSTLRKAFEHSVKRYGESTGEFLQVSGFHVEFDLAKPSGSRVRSLSILCTRCRVPGYEAVEDEAVYAVVVPSYLVAGGDGFSMFKEELLKHNSGDLDISAVSNYISQKKRVYPSVEGRIKIYNSASGPGGPASALVLLVSLGFLWTLCGSV